MEERVTYEFHFEVLADYSNDLMGGAWLTVYLTAVASAIGLIAAIVGVVARSSRYRPIRYAIIAYVEIIRNTPFLVQIFFVFFGLPTIGMRMSPDGAALLAMTVNVTAYSIEILRAGIASISRGQVEAGISLGLTQLQIFRYIVLRPALRTIYPALTSQFILLMLTSSVVSAISANDLTSVANHIGSETFRNFEVYIVVTAIYLVLTGCFAAVFAMIRRAVFSYPQAR
jgi:polar amino acid transport system permease protein